MHQGDKKPSGQQKLEHYSQDMGNLQDFEVD
jgi:hypothetical protein